MKAFVYKLDNNGMPALPGMVTGDYKSRATMERYWLATLPAGTYQVICPIGWERRFSLNMSDFKTWVLTIPEK